MRRYDLAEENERNIDASRNSFLLVNCMIIFSILTISGFAQTNYLNDANMDNGEFSTPFSKDSFASVFHAELSQRNFQFQSKQKFTIAFVRFENGEVVLSKETPLLPQKEKVLFATQDCDKSIYLDGYATDPEKRKSGDSLRKVTLVLFVLMVVVKGLFFAHS